MQRFINLFSIFFVLNVCAQSPGPVLTKENIPEVIAAMTPAEKVGLLVGVGWIPPGEGVMKKASGVAGRTMSIPRLGIPSIALADGPAGLRITPHPEGASHPYFCTAFPTATALAATWNPALVEQVGAAMGNETREYGVDIILTPALNIQRDLLCGRNFEYYSEDPHVSGKMAAAMVRGIQSQGVGTSIKHYAANNQETNRETINAVISQRALREIYLRGFEIAVKESEPWTVMSAYNRLNGYYASERYDLLTTVLREEWGFDGLVMSDWKGGRDAVAQMNAGNDLLMPGRYQYEELIQALADHTLDEKVLDRNVERLLELILKTPAYSNYDFSTLPDLEAHSAVSRQAATEAVVLLKNRGVLPLEKEARHIALFGKSSYEFITGGTGAGEVNYKKAVSIKEGLQNAGISIDDDLEQFYMRFIDSVKLHAKEPVEWWFPKKYVVAYAQEPIVPSHVIEEQAAISDLAIITIGRSSGEGWDRTDDTYFRLSDREKDLIHRCSTTFHAKGKEVIVVLNIGGAIETSSWQDDSDAIVLVWQSGQQGGNALVDIVTGKVTPSGKLPITFPVLYSDVPSSESFPGDPIDNPVHSIYKEGIYVGYRYFDTFDIPVSYEFGYGLSYTQFEYSDIRLNGEILEDNLEISFEITNCGKVSGKEIAQLYIKAPTDRIDKPLKELKGFVKTGLLKPGESQRMTLKIGIKDLASFWSGVDAWIADKGTYLIEIGASSKDIRLKHPFVLSRDVMVEKVSDCLYPNVKIESSLPKR